MLYEGTIIAYNEDNGCYGVAYDDGDFESNNADVIKSLIEKWLVKTGQTHASARIQAGAPFALMLFGADSLERKVAMKGGFTFLTGKHTQGLSFELRDYNLPTSSNLIPELQQCLGTALDKILYMCEGFPAKSDEVFILRNFAITLPQLLFVYGTRTEQVRRAVDLFNQGRWEDLWKLAIKAGERAKARTAKNPRQSKPKSDAQKDAYSQKCARAGNLSKAAATLYKTSPPACNTETVERLRILHPEGDLDYPKDSRPSAQQEADFWESEDGTKLLTDVFSVRNVGAYFRSASPLGAPDPDGWRGREHISHLFLNDDTEAQERIIKHLIVPYAKGEFLQSDLHEHAGGRLSAFFIKERSHQDSPHQQPQQMAPMRGTPYQCACQARCMRIFHRDDPKFCPKRRINRRSNSLR